MALKCSNTGPTLGQYQQYQAWASSGPAVNPAMAHYRNCQWWAIIVICMLNQCMHYLQWAMVGITIAMESIIADIGPIYPCYLGRYIKF